MRGGIQDLKETKQLADDGVNAEKQQEQLLMSKLAANGKLPAKPQSTFLQKKLQQQRKFFDSGDYAMSKEKTKNPAANMPSTYPEADKIPGCAPVPSATYKKSDALSLNVDVAPAPDESLQIPRPDTVPQRKSSIIYPSVHSKLSPQLHIHHHSSHDADPLSES